MEDIAFSPDGRTLYAGGTSGWVYAYEASSGRVTMRVLASRETKPVYGYRVSKVDVSPDGTLVAAGTGPDGDVYVWDTKTGKRVVVISSKGSTVSDLAFSPDSRELVVGGGMRMALDVWRIR
jgi:WD40 repeat protein